VSGAADDRRVTVDDLLALARARIGRLAPVEAHAAAREGALIVDIRADADRERTGVVPGSLHVPRTVLEWRLDPANRTRNPHADGRRIVVLCDHGYSSSLAAATLVDLGRADAADVDGGVEAWLAAGLPLAPPTRRRSPGAPAGMEPPEPHPG
jgi:rhodanese-related sulfurtransferase